jgi:hypothetical protein
MKNVETIKRQRIYSLLRGIVIFFLITISLFHIYFDSYPTKSVEKNNNHYDYLTSSRDSIENSLIKQLAIGEITKEIYIDKLSKNKSYYKKQISLCNAEKRQILKDFSFNGRNSFHYWLFIFGLSISFFSLALLYNYRIVKNSKNKFLKKSLKFESISWTAVSLFWVIHSIFVNKADLPTALYAIVTFSICLAIGYSIFYFIKYLVNRKRLTLESYKNSIRRLISLISDIRFNHYFHMAAKAQNKDNEKIIKKDVEIVEKKIFSTLEKVADDS